MQQIHVVFDPHIIQMAICEFFFNALKIDGFILKVPLLLFISLPGTQRNSTKGWGIAEAYRCRVEFQCYKLFVKDTYDWRQLPLLWKKLLEKDFKHSILMTWYHEGYIRHFHIDHNTPFLSPNILHNQLHIYPRYRVYKKNFSQFLKTFQGPHSIFKDHLTGNLFPILYKNSHSQSILTGL